jgi:RNA recognition motif-containing protein
MAFQQIRAVYVANAPITITKSDVSDLFKRFGQIDSIFLSAELPKKVCGRPTRARATTAASPRLTREGAGMKQQRRDWLVVTFATRESAVEAIRTMHGHLLNGYKIALTFYVQVHSSRHTHTHIITQSCTRTTYAHAN